ncbi:hypothetical protein [Nocardia sp. NPDC051832]|uniref:hypothetical protein n=1 Tax=Nocardia sp. NPDC051832 TaxID=3155673 RepID=UPI0034230C84
MPPSPLTENPTAESLTRCRRCGRTIEQPHPSVSCHRTSEGTIRYTRCSCGMAQIWLRPAHYAPAEILHR